MGQCHDLPRRCYGQPRFRTAPAILLVDACHGSVTHVGSRLRSLLTAHKLWLALSDELAAASEPAVLSLSSELLAGAEDFTGIPEITSVLVLDGPEPGPQPHPADASHWIRLLRRALTLIVVFFGVPMVANAAPSRADWWPAKAEGAFARGERFFGSLRTRCAERRRHRR